MSKRSSTPLNQVDQLATSRDRKVLVSVRSLACSRGGKRLFHDVDFSLRRGEWTVILGGNGVGKSTLLMALVGLKDTDQGVIEVSEKPLHLWNRRSLAKEIALLQQSPESGLGVTVRENTFLGRAPWQDGFGTKTAADEQVVSDALCEAGVTSLADRPLETLSGGEKRRAFLAQALAQKTKVLLLDEPTAFLDVKQQCLVLKIVRQKIAEGLAVASVLHDPNQALHADQIILMFDDGSVEIGPPETTLTCEKLSALYGTTISSAENAMLGEKVFMPLMD